MSKYLVAFVNGTNESINFINTEDASNNQTLIAGSMFTTQVHFNIPDISDLQSDFSSHHMGLQRSDGTQIFSMWDDPTNNDYVINFCYGVNWLAGTSPLAGYNPKGNGVNVGIVLLGNFPNYTIQSYSVLYDV